MGAAVQTILQAICLKVSLCRAPAFDLGVDVLVEAAIEPQPLASSARDPSQPSDWTLLFQFPIGSKVLRLC